MLKIKIISLFPDLINSYLQDAILAKAIGKNLISVELINLRDFSDNAYKSVDEVPFGGGDGMLIRADILEKALQSVNIKKEKQLVIYFTPQGKLLEQSEVRKFAEQVEFDELILICGRYAGIDQRFIDEYVGQEISIGNYVLSGGELPALVLIEAVSRFIPGVLGKIESAFDDSLQENLLEAPQYTKPQIWNNKKVPDVLLSGHHQKIANWKKEMALKVTSEKRPDLLKGFKI
jgi:tRNA (guanine37-N1)-methyltransferase